MSINRDYLLLELVNLSNDLGEVRYQFLVNDEVHFFVGQLMDMGGIRSVEFPEEFDKFLRPFLTRDPAIVKNLVRITWSFVEGEGLSFPIALSSGG